MKKYLFFDIDGTLTNANPGGIVTESTKRTLKKLKENGHFIAIATGRANYFAIDFAKENGFENMVSDGGNGLMINNEVQEIEPLDFTTCNQIIDECLKADIPFAVAINNEATLYSNYPKEIKMQMPGTLHQDTNIDFHQVNAIYKIFIGCTIEQEAKIPSILKLPFMRYLADHVIIEPMDKYKGIKKMVTLVGGKEEDIVVFGDGKNDYSMMKEAPMSIAMGNAIDEVKEIATFVTKSNVEDGIEYACKHFGWM